MSFRPRLMVFFAAIHGVPGEEVAVALVEPPAPAPRAAMLAMPATALPVSIRGDLGFLPKLDIRLIGAGKPRLEELSFFECSSTIGLETRP